MRNEPHRCLAGCGRAITYQFAICSDCEQIYGRSSLEWPYWLRWLWNDIQRERRRDRNVAHFEITFSELAEDEPGD